MKNYASYILAFLISVAVLGWMLSDNLIASFQAPVESKSANQSEDKQSENVGTEPGSKLTISAVTVNNKLVTKRIRANGFTQAEFEMVVSSKAEGEIIDIPAREGARINDGMIVAQIERGTLVEQIVAARASLLAAKKRQQSIPRRVKTLNEQIAGARANLAAAKKRQEVADRLEKNKLGAPLEGVERAAEVANALAALRQLEDQLADRVVINDHNSSRTQENDKISLVQAERAAEVANSVASLRKLEKALTERTVLAGVSGYLEKLHVEKGERVRQDTPIATIIGLEKVSVVVAVPQIDVGQIELGTQVQLSVAGVGEEIGVVSKIASKSNPLTRTFDVEIEILNRNGRLRAGISVEATIDAGITNAFSMSPAHLSVTENGKLSAKVLENDRVTIVPVEIVRSGAENVDVTGLPDGAILLTVGQAFVSEGSRVNYRLESDS